VLQAQNADGSWPYSTDEERLFVDHFHTCFVLKALAKIEAITKNPACTKAIERGVDYYVKNLFDEAGLPKPFSRRPRMTVYRRELYDYASASMWECCWRAATRRSTKSWRGSSSSKAGRSPTALSAAASFSSAGTTFPCIAGLNRKCFEVFAFCFIETLRVRT
jgi:hypothetical protein